MSYILLFVAGSFAWFISTVAAGGAATLLVPLIGLLLGPSAVAPVISVSALMANPSRVLLFHPEICWDLVKYLVPGTICGALFGAWLFTRLDPQWLQIIMGLFVISYVLQYRFSRVRLKLHVKTWWFLPIGIAVSGVSGLVGASGPVLNPFLIGYGLRRQELIATKAVNSLVMQVSKLATYGLLGAMSLGSVAYGLVLGCGAIAGVWLARKHLIKIEQHRFELYVHLLMLVSGVVMLFSAFNR